MNNVRIINDEYIKQIAETTRSLGKTINKMKPNDIPSNIRNIDMGIRFNSNYGGVIENSGLSLANKFVSNTSVFYPVIGYAVTNCHRTFFNCRNAMGEPIMKSNLVDSLGETFADCWSLTGAPQCGTNVTNLTKAYYNCQNLDGYMKADDATYQNVQLAAQAFYMDVNLKGELTQLPNATNMYQMCYGCSSIGGTAYIPATVTDLTGAFQDCTNLKGANFICDADNPSNVVTMVNAFRNCSNIEYLDFSNAPKITNMQCAFMDCCNMTGTPYIPNTVAGAGMFEAYRNCGNITGRAMLSSVATDGREVYLDCSNITAAPYSNCLTKLTTVTWGFCGCRNMRGSMIFTTATTNYAHAFENCMELGSVYIPHTNVNVLKAANLAGAFAREPGGNRLNVIFASFAILNIGRAAAAAGCAMTGVVAATEDIQFPECYNNGKVYGYTERRVVRGCYNEEYNLYMYSIA